MTASQLELPHVGALKLAPMMFAPELASWLTAGRTPDNDMLAAILRNDLAGTFAFIGHDGGGWRLVHALLAWLLQFGPPTSYGSAEAVRAWQRQGGLKGGKRQ